MKILAVCPYDIDRPGGVQRHILDSGAALAELGHEVTVLAPRTTTPPKASPPGVVIERLGRARAIGLGGTRFEISLPLGAERRRLRALIRNGGFDVGWFHTVWTPFLAPMALAYFSGPAVCMFHDTPGNGLVGRTMAAVFRRISRPLLPRFGAILTPSRTPQAHLAGAQRMEVFAPCTDLRRFHDAAPQPGFADGRVNILYLGRLEPRKGAHILLQAYRRLCDSVPGVRLILAGAGPEEHTLRAYAAEHHLSGVVFAGAPADAAPWFAASDIFCAPSLYGESFGIVLTEAMSAGKPVVAAANAGYRTVLTGQAARFLVPPGDVAALAEALGILAQDEALRARLGAWGRAAAPAYDCRALAPRLVEIFRDTVIAHRLKTTGLRARSAT